MRRTRRDWLTLGETLLRDEGEQALTLERLCREMRLTRGSFYHHFGGTEAYRQALLHGWQERLTEEVILELPAGHGGTYLLALLGQRVAQLDHRLDLAFRAWSLRDEGVRAVMEAVDARRIALLTELHAHLGHERPEDLARLDYASFVGMQALGWLPQDLLLQRLQSRATGLLAQEIVAGGGEGAAVSPHALPDGSLPR